MEFENAVFLASCAVDKLDAFGRKLSLGIVTNAGFEKCLYADHLFMPSDSENYLELPEFSEQTKTRLAALFAKYKLSAVIDIDQILDTTPTIPDSAYYEFAQVLLETCGAVIISPVPETHMISTLSGASGALIGRDFKTEGDSLPLLCAKLAKEQNKLVVVTVECGWKFEDFRQYCIDEGICVFAQAD